MATCPVGLCFLAAVALVSIVTSGCIGATDRADFDEEVRSRGGGISSTWIDESLDAAANALGLTDATDLEFLTLSINGTTRTVIVNGRRGDRPDYVDSVAVRQGDVVSVAPLQDADELPLDDITIPLEDVPIDDIETLVDIALADFGEVDASVATITVSLAGGTPTITMRLASARRTGTAEFDLDGELVRVPR